jgi:hypothetical protein
VVGIAATDAGGEAPKDAAAHGADCIGSKTSWWAPKVCNRAAVGRGPTVHEIDIQTERRGGT